YMRKSFTIEDVSAIEAAIFHIDYDDGFVAYINGVEIARANLDGSPPYYNAFTPNGREAQMYSGGVPEQYDISDPQNIFREGENVLAVEVHNHTEGSSDLTSIPFLSVLSPTFPGPLPPALPGLENRLFHTNFRLDADGDSLYLTNPEGTVVDSLIIEWQAKDHSFGRLPATFPEWYLFETPTPGEPNHTRAYIDYLYEQPQFSRPGGRFHASFQLSISSVNPEDSIYFTIDGSEPGRSSSLYVAPIPIAEGKVVKAVILKEGYLPVRPAVQTYISGYHTGLPVISISTDPDNLWDHDHGIYVRGPGASNDFPYFGANFWNAWERPVHVQLYDENDSLAFNIGAGVKVFGGWSRGHPQKSLSLFARAKYGDRRLEYQLFPGIHILDFEAFVLRNSGNDWFGAGSEAGTMFRDLMMTSLMANMDVEYQKGRQAVLYINGEYFGIHNIREKVNEHFLESNTGVDPDRIELLTNNQEVIHGSKAHYSNLYNFINSNNLQIQANYEYVKQRMDINNFIQYQLAQIYFDNTDWPGNNIKYWRPDYENGRWRWI
ncbi:MAG: CotH kinase family protein, partial [Bacteroidales bacterium]|nr:CotH kinase family protein [Bacteroidales bacterium]